MLGMAGGEAVKPKKTGREKSLLAEGNPTNIFFFQKRQQSFTDQVRADLSDRHPSL